MKFIKILSILTALLLLTGCSQETPAEVPEGIAVVLSDEGVTVDGVRAGTDPESAVYVGNDIIYYAAGQSFTYGEGTDEEAHSSKEAAAHTVVHIGKPGAYRLSGKLSQGQIAVDLGESAQYDPNAVVTLILDGVDITCHVAPAVIFYNVYECGNADAATWKVDTTNAGANVILADGSQNTVRGSYVAKIYEPDSVELNEEGTKVKDADKLHKYDGAFYSKMSMNIRGGAENTGLLQIHAENEGLDTELHLTIDGGNICIFSGNDGINTNEDGRSVTTINGGNLTIRVTGETGEGDGIDSNGWLVINGGTVTAAACATSEDAGIDSDMGIHINGGTVVASGHMLDRIEDGGQNYAVFSFGQECDGAAQLRLQKQSGKVLMEQSLENACSILLYSGPELKAGRYTLWSGDQQLAGQMGNMMAGPGTAEEKGNAMEPPEGETRPGRPEFPEGNPSAGMPEPPEGEAPPPMPNGPQGNDRAPAGQNLTTTFKITKGANYFDNISPVA